MFLEQKILLKNIFQQKQKNVEQGFTLPEVLVAMVISMTIAAAVAAVVLGGTSLLGSSQETVVQTVRSQATVDDIANMVRDASFIVPENVNTTENPSYSSAHLAFIYQRNSTTCEYQQYWITPLIDSTGAATNYSELRHGATSLTGLPAGESCMTNYKALYDGRMLDSQQGELIMGDLVTGSQFTYYGINGSLGSPDGHGVSFGFGKPCTLDPNIPLSDPNDPASPPLWISSGAILKSIGITFINDSYGTGVDTAQTTSTIVTPLYLSNGGEQC